MKGVFAAALLIVALTACPAVETIANDGTRVGNRAIDFTLVDQNGNTVSLHDYEGKVILLDISTMWCPPCQDEARVAEALYQKYKDRDFVIINILISNYDRGPIAQSDTGVWANDYHLTFPILADLQRAVWGQYNEEGYIPLNLVIDRDLTIRYKEVGYNEGAIEAAIASLLED